MAVNPLHLPSSQNVIIPPSVMKDIFYQIENSGLTVLAVLVSVVSDEKSIVIGIAPLYVHVFSLWLLSRDFSLFLVFKLCYDFSGHDF